jgi:tRNA modification GTPase
LAGRPNAGKSSLLNSLSQKDVSIVSPEAGTTRDVVEVRLDLAGFPLILQDTAGVRQGPECVLHFKKTIYLACADRCQRNSLGFVEREGINRALSNFKNANIRIILFDLSEFDGSALHPDDENLLAMVKESPDNCLIVLNKADLKASSIGESALFKLFGGLPRVTISAKSGDGVPNLLSNLETLVKNLYASSATLIILSPLFLTDYIQF